jgi:hypothetical protein
VFLAEKFRKRIQTGELQKNRIFLKKSVDKRDGAWYYKQALERAGQKRRTMTAQTKALCKLNNDHENKEP